MARSKNDYLERRANLLPPRRFTPVGPIEWAENSLNTPPFLTSTKKKARGAVAKGLKYEQDFKNYMEDRFGGLYVPGPWFHYREIGKEKNKWCQPDGLLFIPRLGKVYIIETKLKHTSDAWWQLKHLYLPVVAKLFPPNLWEYCLIEVVRWYDPQINFQEKVRMCPDVLSVEPGEFGVHIWMPR